MQQFDKGAMSQFGKALHVQISGVQEMHGYAHDEEQQALLAGIDCKTCGKKAKVSSVQ